MITLNEILAAEREAMRPLMDALMIEAAGLDALLVEDRARLDALMQGIAAADAVPLAGVGD